MRHRLRPLARVYRTSLSALPPCLLSVLTGCRAPAPAAAAGTFQARALPEAGGPARYQVYLPPGFQAAPEPARRRVPVLLFLHGAGERGDDGVLPTTVGLGPALRRAPERYPFLVIFPQCAKDAFWTTPAMQERALRTLDAVLAELGGDPARVALTGISMGGYGTMALGAAEPGRFRALAPVCGGLEPPPAFNIPPPPLWRDAADPYALIAGRLGSKPVWLFHGDRDDVVPVLGSRRLFLALRAGGAARYSEYPGVGHDVWEQAYAEPDLPTFLGAHAAP